MTPPSPAHEPPADPTASPGASADAPPPVHRGRQSDPRPFVYFEFVTHYGGSHKVAVRLAGQLRRRFADVVVVDPYGACPEYVRDLEAEGVPVRVLMPGARATTIGGRGSAARAWRLARSVPHLLRLVRAVRRSVAELEPRAIWVSSEKALLTVCRATGARVPIVVHVQGWFQRMNPLARRCWRRVPLIVGCARAAVECFARFGLPGRVEVMHNAIDVAGMERLAAEDPGPLPGGEGPLRIIQPANLIPLKNHAMAIRGTAEFVRRGGDAHLWICGDSPGGAGDPFVRDLLELPRRLGVADRVHFLGWRPNVPAVMRRSDVMVLTSNTEGMPVSILEAMALGRPVVATRVGGVPELVRDGVEGILLDPDDAAGFAQAMERLRDAGERERMGRAGRERVEREFSLERQVERFYELLSSVTAERQA